MDKNSFEILLGDLFDRYNPNKKTDIPELLEKYNGQEFDAVYHILLKYNYPKNPLYDADFNNPQYVKTLIGNYSQGKRTILEKKKITEQDKINESVTEANKQIKSATEKTAELIEEKIKKLDEFVQAKYLELEKISEIQKKIDNDIEIRINMIYENAKFELPSHINGMPAGSRLILNDTTGRPHGLEIKDVFYDYISVQGKCIKIITIDKV